MASLARLTSLSTQTLSLLLERQRLQTLSNPSATSLHIPQITRNMQQLRAGILDLEEKDGRSEAVSLLRSQYERMRSMLGPDGEAAGIEKCVVSFECVVAWLSWMDPQDGGARNHCQHVCINLFGRVNAVVNYAARAVDEAGFGNRRGAVHTVHG